MVAILEVPVALEKNTERVDLRVPISWLKRIELAAEKKSLKVSAYLRMVATERMDLDGIPVVEVEKPKKPKS